MYTFFQTVRVFDFHNASAHACCNSFSWLRGFQWQGSNNLPAPQFPPWSVCISLDGLLHLILALVSWCQITVCCTGVALNTYFVNCVNASLQYCCCAAQGAQGDLCLFVWMRLIGLNSPLFNNEHLNAAQCLVWQLTCGTVCRTEFYSAVQSHHLL